MAAAAIPTEQLAMLPASVDPVVSSYALHHLRDADKAQLIADTFHWLRPGGTIVLADMMFGGCGPSRDREKITQKLVLLARKGGPGGWWRIAKVAARCLLRVQECPVSMAAWTLMLDQEASPT